MSICRLFAVLGLLCAVAAARAAAPIAPSNVTAVPVGFTGVNLTWQDNSANENSFRIMFRTDTNASFVLFSSTGANQTNFTVTGLSPLTTYQFVIRAFASGSSFADSAPVTVTTGGPPSNVTVTPTNPTSLRLAWKDNSTNEAKFQIAVSLAGSNSYTLGGEAPANATNHTIIGLFEPGLAYDFFVRAYVDTNIFADSPGVTFTNPPFNKPTQVTATITTPATVNLRWKDNTTNETLFYIARREGTNAFAIPSGWVVASNITNFAATFLTPGTTNQFLIGAYYSDTLNDYATESTNITVVMPPFNAPTNLQATATNTTSITLAWTDISNNETNFRVIFRSGTNGDFFIADLVPANTTNFTATNLAPATTYQFIVQSFIDENTTADSALITTHTLDTLTGRKFHPAVAGQAITPYTLTVSTVFDPPTSFAATGLPPGLALAGNQITGTPTTSGVFTAALAANFPTGTASNTLTFRVIKPAAPPVVVSNIPAQTFATNGPAVNLPLGNFFADPDTETAVRIVTTKGTFDAALYDTAAPQTVANFLGYVNRGDFNNSILSRASLLSGVLPFVVQGGGFKPNGADFDDTPTTPSPTNEPGIQHARGTLAMAKQPNLPNSATSEWFVNMRDNSDQLDDQNSGFAAFARICGTGVSVADAIMDLPRADYTVTVHKGTNTFPQFFSDVPLDTTNAPPATLDPAHLVLVQSATPVAPLAYSVAGNSAPGVFSATITNGTNLVLARLSQFGGSALITVAATDLDGNVVTQQFTATITSPYTTWLGQFALTGDDALPGADGDGDNQPNAAEFALMGSPTISDAAGLRGSNSLVTVGNQQFLALTFKVRKSLGGAVVLVRAAAEAVGGTFATIWTSDDAGNPLEVSRADGGDHWLLTVRDSAPTPPATRRFLNLKVQTPP